MSAEAEAYFSRIDERVGPVEQGFACEGGVVGAEARENCKFRRAGGGAVDADDIARLPGEGQFGGLVRQADFAVFAQSGVDAVFVLQAVLGGLFFGASDQERSDGREDEKV